MSDIVREVEVYPLEAYEFVQLGLEYTVSKLGRDRRKDDDVEAAGPVEAGAVEAGAVEAGAGRGGSRHVTGQELSLGLREYAWERWGLLARTVLKKWNVTSTMDFGKIVYAMIEGGVLAKSPTDKLEDFRNVYDFSTLERLYVTDLSRMAKAEKAAPHAESPSP